MAKSGFVVGGILFLIGFIFKFRKGLSVFFGIIILLGVFSYLFAVFGNRIDNSDFNWDDLADEWNSDSEDDEMWALDENETNEVAENFDSEDYYSHSHSWRDNDHNRYSSVFEMKKETFDKSRRSRERHRVFEDTEHDV